LPNLNVTAYAYFLDLENSPRSSNKTVGIRVKGGSIQAFQTPLATLHAFQGWADKFLATPADGIEDLYVSIATKIHGANVSLIYHRFNPEVGGGRITVVNGI